MTAELAKRLETLCLKWWKREVPPDQIPHYFSEAGWRDLNATGTALLAEEPQDLDALENWFHRWDQYSSWYFQISSIFNVEALRDTNDLQIKAGLQAFESICSVEFQSNRNAAATKLLEHPLIEAWAAHGERSIIRKRLQADVLTFRDDAAELQIKERGLARQYSALVGKLQANFNGYQLTLQELGKAQESTDRSEREQAWRLEWEQRRAISTEVESIMLQLIATRKERAAVCGFASFRELSDKVAYRFDYGVTERKQFRAGVREFWLPLLHQELKERTAQLEMQALRPWDRNRRAESEEDAANYASSNELLKRVRQVLDRLDPHFVEVFDQMNEKGLFDLETRLGKGPGGFCASRPFSLPFIFYQLMGTQRDIEVVFHEFGHAMHGVLVDNHLPFHAMKQYPGEFAEVASFGMEFMTMEHWNMFLEPAALRAARAKYFRGVVSSMALTAMTDEFEDWLYAEPQLKSGDISDKWSEIYRSYYPPQLMDWSGLEGELGINWQRIPHFFSHPLYMMNYGVAKLGALQYWQNFRLDPKATLKRYKTALALGGGASLPDLFRAMGVEFDFSSQRMQSLAHLLR